MGLKEAAPALAAGGLQNLSELGKVPDSENLHAHYDVSEESGLSDGDSISSLEDQSGNGNTISDGSATYRGSDMNGLPTAGFDGGNDTLWSPTSTWSTITKPATIYLAVDFDDVADLDIWLSEASTGSYPLMMHNNDYQVEWYDYITGGAASTGDQLTTLKYDGSDTRSWKDGSLELDRPDTTTPDMTGLAIGPHYYGNSRYPAGRLGELLVYDTDHDQSTREEVESYLADKWGITI